MLKITPLTPHIGALIEGVNVAQLNDEQFAQIHDAFLQHQVIFLRDQAITPAEQLAFAARFGPLEPPHPLFPNVPEHPQVSVLLANREKPPGESWWHTDVTWKEVPPLASVLHAQAVPAAGGDTIWASMTAAYDTLSKPMQTFLGQLTAVHSLAAFLGGNFDDDQGKVRAAMEKYPPVEQPVIRTHPITKKKAIFVNPQFTLRIKGLPKAESHAILTMLHQITQDPTFQVRFHWEKQSLAMWDNRCTQHYAVTDYYPSYRKMHRVTITGDRPFF